MKTSHLIDWKNLFIINYVRKTSRKDCFNPLSNAPKGYHLNFDFIVFIYQNKIFFGTLSFIYNFCRSRLFFLLFHREIDSSNTQFGILQILTMNPLVTATFFDLRKSADKLGYLRFY